MIPNGFKPLLAINKDKVTKQPDSLHYSLKLNGVRCIFFGGVAYARSLIPLPNQSLQEYASSYAELLEGVDSEVIVGNPYDIEVLNNTVSFCMSKDKIEPFYIYAFDRYHPSDVWINRYTNLQESLSNKLSQVIIHSHYPFTTEEELYKYEEEILRLGAEGLILRDTYGKYKCGRSGKIRPELQKLKRFLDEEFEVIGFSVELHNTNELSKDNVGHAKRSTSKEGLIPKERLGSLTCITKDGYSFGVGGGFTAKQREELWLVKDSLVGQLVTVQYFSVGVDKVPLLPTFKGIRHPLDT